MKHNPADCLGSTLYTPGRDIKRVRERPDGPARNAQSSVTRTANNHRERWTAWHTCCLLNDSAGAPLPRTGERDIWRTFRMIRVDRLPR